MIFAPQTFNIQADPKNEVLRMNEEIFDNDCYFPAFGNKVIVDIGACIGMFSMYAYRFAKVIYAIEPHPTNYKNLLANIKNNKLDKIQPFNIAVAEKNSLGWIRENSSLEGSTFDFDKEGYKVEARTLDTFFTEQQIQYADIVKIDVEGYEQKIFNEESFKKVLPKIGVIIAEIHGEVDFPHKEMMPVKIDDQMYLFRR